MPPPREGRGPAHAPPQEAITACASLAADAACAFTAGDKNVTGTCALPPESTTLACRPSGPPPGHQGERRGPPPEAITACASLAANAACAFTLGSTNLTGTCVAPPGGASGALACRPDRMPPPPGQ
jgi:hypothetical protein